MLIRGANARNVSFKTLYGGQFTLSTQLIILNDPVNKLSQLQRIPGKKLLGRYCLNRTEILFKISMQYQVDK